MQKYSLIVLLAGIMLPLTAQVGWQQEIHSPGGFTPTYYNEISDPFSGTYSHNIMPIGWSADGKFAFIHIFNQNDGRAAEEFRFLIVNAVSDEILYREDVVPMDWEEEDLNWDREMVLHAWDYSIDSYYKALSAHDIRPLSREAPESEVLNFPLKSGVYSFESEYEQSVNDATEIGKFSVSLIRGDGKRKTCTTGEIEKLRFGFAEHAFKSPYEERVLIIFGHIIDVPDWEVMPREDGTPSAWMQDMTIGFTGANLRIGFK